MAKSSHDTDFLTSSQDGCCAGSCITRIPSSRSLRCRLPTRRFICKCALFAFLIVAGLSVSIVLYATFHQNEQVVFRRSLHTRCQDRTKALQGLLSSISSVAYHYQGLYAIALNQTRTGDRRIRASSQIQLFAAYSKTFTLVDRIMTIGYISQSERVAWEATRTITATSTNQVFFYPNYTDIDPVINLVRALPTSNTTNTSTVLFPLDTLLPPVPRYDLTGWDLSTVPSLASSITSAVSSGTLQASGRSTLFAYNNTFGILVFLAVYATQFTPTLDQREAQTIGLVASVHPVGDLLLRTAGTTDDDPIAITIYDRDASPSTSFLAELQPNNRPTLQPSENTSVLFNFGNRQYEMVCTPSQDFVDSGYSTTPLFIAIGTALLFLFNILLTILACVYLSMRRAVQRSEYLAATNHQNEVALQALEQATAITNQANQSKSDFLAFLCHELRNPLHSIVAMINFLENEEDGPLTQQQHELVETVQASVSSMSAIVNEALDMSSIEAGKMTLEVVPFTLPEVLRSIASGEQSRAHNKGITLEMNMDPLVFPPIVYGDPNRFRQVVLNLLSNAVKFTSQGSVSIHVSRLPNRMLRMNPIIEESGLMKFPTTRIVSFVPLSNHRPSQPSIDAKGSTSTVDESYIVECIVVQVQVIDTGMGIPREAFDHLFEPYSQAKLSVMKTFGGTGLGLAIAKQIVDQVGGSIAVDSAIGTGTTVTVQFPFRMTPLATKISPPQPSQRRLQPAVTTISYLEPERLGHTIIAASPPSATEQSQQPPVSYASSGSVLTLTSDRNYVRSPSTSPLPQTLSPPMDTSIIKTISHHSIGSSLTPAPHNLHRSDSTSAIHLNIHHDDNDDNNDHDDNENDNKNSEKACFRKMVEDEKINNSSTAPVASSNIITLTSPPHTPSLRRRRIANPNHQIADCSPTSRLSILVVDDSPVNIKILCRMLQGHDLTTAYDGQQAVDAVLRLILQDPALEPQEQFADIAHTPPDHQHHHSPVIRRQFDVIFSDIVMPVMDGLTSARKIRQIERLYGLLPIPIVAVTANAFFQDREACATAGINYFLSKPFHKNDIVRIIDTITHHHASNISPPTLALSSQRNVPTHRINIDTQESI